MLRPAAVMILLALTLVCRDSQGFVGHFPDQWHLALSEPLDRVFKFLASDLAIGPLSLSGLTRMVSAALAWPLDLLASWLTEGTYLLLPGGDEIELSQLPWVSVATVAVLAAGRLGGLHGALLATATLAFVYALGLWASTMATLVSVVFAVALSAAIGLSLGIIAARSDRLSRLLEPVYDAIQTVPIFSYLAIVLIFFGFGAVTALIATVIFAVAPMARLTELSIRQVPQSIQDLASISGCTPYQRLFWVELPSAKQGLLLGLNQVTMLSLSMVIIASIIGAGGLGNDVLRGLKSLRLAEALLAGLAISFIAITIDRTMRAGIERRSAGRGARSGVPGTAIACIGLVALTVTAYQFEPLQFPPDRALVDFSTIAGNWLSAINGPGSSVFFSMRDGFIVFVLVPFRDFFVSLPWLPFILLVGTVGFFYASRALAAVSVLLLASIAILGLWDKAMLSLYLVVLSLIVSFLVALPLGLLFGLNSRAYDIMEVCADMIQTLPSFIYLIPIVVLFGAGDFPAFLAIVAYLLAPIVRYNAHAIKQVAFSSLNDVAEMSGCSLPQRLFLVYLPVSSRQILLGVNQAVMLGFSMLVITALVGSRGLEETTLVAIAQVKPGLGFLAGFGIAALAFIMDRMIRGLSRHIVSREKS